MKAVPIRLKCSFIDHRGYEDKVVVVVGVGNSGGDVAVELSRVAKQVIFCSFA